MVQMEKCMNQNTSLFLLKKKKKAGLTCVSVPLAGERKLAVIDLELVNVTEVKGFHLQCPSVMIACEF